MSKLGLEQYNGVSTIARKNCDLRARPCASKRVAVDPRRKIYMTFEAKD